MFAQPTDEALDTDPVEIAMSALRGKWTTLIIRGLLKEDLSFTELSEALPAVSAKVLTDRLTHLIGVGVVRRYRESTYPPRVCYALTQHGEALDPVIRALGDWGSASDRAT